MTDKEFITDLQNLKKFLCSRKILPKNWKFTDDDIKKLKESKQMDIVAIRGHKFWNYPKRESVVFAYAGKEGVPTLDAFDKLFELFQHQSLKNYSTEQRAGFFEAIRILPKLKIKL